MWVRRIGAVVGAVGMGYLFYDAPSLVMATGMVLIGAAAGWAGGMISAALRNRQFRTMGKYLGAVLGLAVLGLAVMAYFLGGGTCQAAFHYTAENTFTEECDMFVYGGCGPRDHPWYYEKGCSKESKQQFCDEASTYEQRMVCGEGPLMGDS